MSDLLIPVLILGLMLLAVLAALLARHRGPATGAGLPAGGYADHRESQRRQAEELERLARLHALGSAALDTVADAVIYLDRDRRIVYVNKAARSLVRLEAGRPLIESLRDHDLENLLRRCIAQGEEQSATVALTRPRRVVRATVRPVGGVGVVMVLTDRTELHHLERVRRDLVANVSHELRTPLATLQLLVETVLESTADDAQARDFFLGKIREHLTHIGGIVQQSLYLASLESGERSVAASPVDVPRLVEASVGRLAPQAERAGLAVHVDLAPDLPPVQADFEQVSRVLTNILDNAIRWTPPGGSVCVSAERDDGFVRFEVRDTGPGVPPERLPRLFERFYTGDEARSAGGTGLGLSIAKHTVQMHGGRIWAESEEGHGASFFFTLPVSDSVAHPATP
jgi:two-component system phosphate regulon sensor histidine kinase PhoR